MEFAGKLACEVLTASDGGAVAKVRSRTDDGGSRQEREAVGLSQPFECGKEDFSCCSPLEVEAGSGGSMSSITYDEGSRSCASICDRCSGAAVANPILLLQGILSCKVSKEDAAGIAVSYYNAVAAVSGQVQQVPSSAVTTSSYSQRREERLDRWNAEVSSLPNPSGQCYLNVIRPGRRHALLSKLGRYPKLQDFVGALEPRDLMIDEAKRFGMYRIGGMTQLPVQYHVAEAADDGSVFVGKVFDVVVSTLHHFPAFNKQELGLEAHLIDMLPVVAFGVLGGRDLRLDTTVSPVVSQSTPCVAETPISLEPQSALPVERVSVPESLSQPPVPSGELRALAVMDFEECRCQIHRVPQTARSKGGGCAMWSAGTAPSLTAAFHAANWYCHAEPSVRRNDKKVLQYMLSGIARSALDNDKLPRALRQYCTSAMTDITTFGNGYCYLQLMRPEAWWRVARLLGPNPRLDSVMLAMYYFGVRTGQLRGCVRVSESLYHVQMVASSARVDANAGIRAYRELQLLVATHPDARVG